MKIKSLVVGPVAANCYILSDATGEGAVIDFGLYQARENQG